MDVRTRLDELESRLAQFIVESDGDLEVALQRFASEADEICDVANADVWPYVSSRLDAMLQKHGIGAFTISTE